MATAAKIEAEVLPSATDIMLAVEATPQIVLLEPEKFDQFYERVKAETEKLVIDVSTKKGRDEIIAMASKVTKSKTAIDKARLQLTGAWREQTNQVNAAGKEIETRLVALAKEVRQPVTDWEAAEKERIDECNAVITELALAGTVTLDDTAETVRARGKKVWETTIDPERFGGLSEQAERSKVHTVDLLKTALARLTREEEDRAELEWLRAAEAERVERERAAQEAREAKEREEAKAREVEERRAAADKADAERIERARAEAAEAAKREAENAARLEREAAEKAQRAEVNAANERARLAEESAQRQRDEAAQAEREREAQIKAEAAEQARRDRNKAHKSRLMAEAKIAIMAAANDGHAVEHPITEAAAVQIVRALVAGHIPHATWSF